MGKKGAKPAGLWGERALLVAVVQQAVKDATGQNSPHVGHVIDAWAYLTGPDYRHHAELLDRPGRLPPAIERLLDDHGH